MFKKWFLTGHNSNNLYLFDHEFIGNNITGLSLIKELGIDNISVLVTSHHNSPEIQLDAKKHRIKVLSKSSIPNIVIKKLEKIDLVLIDDDDLIRTTWEIAAKSNNKAIKTFGSVSEFLKNTNESPVDLSTPIYIDSDLGDVKGEIISKKIFELGFRYIILETGHQNIDISKYSWIAGIINKNYPRDHII